jgi:hypothetical protein
MESWSEKFVVETEFMPLEKRSVFLWNGSLASLSRDPFNRPARCHGVVRLPDMRQPDI